MIKKLILGIAVRINAITAIVAIALIGSGVAFYSGRAALITVGAILLLDSYVDKFKRVDK